MSDGGERTHLTSFMLGALVQLRNARLLWEDYGHGEMVGCWLMLAAASHVRSRSQLGNWRCDAPSTSTSWHYLHRR